MRIVIFMCQYSKFQSLAIACVVALSSCVVAHHFLSQQQKVHTVVWKNCVKMVIMNEPQSSLLMLVKKWQHGKLITTVSSMVDNAYLWWEWCFSNEGVITKVRLVERCLTTRQVNSADFLRESYSTRESSQQKPSLSSSWTLDQWDQSCPLTRFFVVVCVNFVILSHAFLCEWSISTPPNGGELTSEGNHTKGGSELFYLETQVQCFCGMFAPGNKPENLCVSVLKKVKFHDRMRYSRMIVTKL
jgi:hypothetical protein